MRAVDGVSLDVRDGEILGLVGPNGSGKTTFLNALVGVVPASGYLEVDGQPVPLGSPAGAGASACCAPTRRRRPTTTCRASRTC